MLLFYLQDISWLQSVVEMCPLDNRVGGVWGGEGATKHPLYQPNCRGIDSAVLSRSSQKSLIIELHCNKFA